MAGAERPKERDCPDCKGTGVDAAKTEKARASGECDAKSYVRCWACNGNGADPAAYFNWRGKEED